MSAFSKFLDGLKEPAYAILRISTGLLFAFHGLQKLTGYQFPAAYIPKIGTQGWIGSILELVGGLLVAGGLFTRCAAFVVCGEMAVAYTQFHWKLHMGAQFFPGVNGGEPALMFCLIFMYIACRGAGILSIDKMRGGK
jgi:putative oxidoreductase